LAHRHHFPAVLVDGHDGRLVDDDAFALRVHQCVGCPQIDRQVGRKQTEDRAQVVTVIQHSSLSAGLLKRQLDAATDGVPPGLPSLTYFTSPGVRLCPSATAGYGITISTRLIAVPPRRF